MDKSENKAQYKWLNLSINPHSNVVCECVFSICDIKYLYFKDDKLQCSVYGGDHTKSWLNSMKHKWTLRRLLLPYWLAEHVLCPVIRELIFTATLSWTRPERRQWWTLPHFYVFSSSIMIINFVNKKFYIKKHNLSQKERSSDNSYVNQAVLQYRWTAKASVCVIRSTLIIRSSVIFSAQMLWR